MVATHVPVLFSLFGFVLGVSVCVHLLVRRVFGARDYSLIAALALLSLRLLACAAFHAGGWYPAIVGGVGATGVFLFWPFLLAYAWRMAGGVPRPSVRLLLATPAVAALALYFVCDSGRWIPFSLAGARGGSSAPVLAGAVVLVAYAAAAIALAWGPPLAGRASRSTRLRAGWLRSLVVLCATMPASLLAAAATRPLLPALGTVLALAEVVLAVAVLEFVAVMTLSGGRVVSPPASPLRAEAAPPGMVVQALKERLRHLMQTARPYRDPNLRISDLAAALDVPVHVLSGIINRELGCNFSDFLNGYRVQEAARLLLDPAKRQYTILSIALEVGFASKASFNRAFKRHMGVTPSGYQRHGAGGLPRSISQ